MDFFNFEIFSVALIELFLSKATAGHLVDFLSFFWFLPKSTHSCFVWSREMSRIYRKPSFTEKLKREPNSLSELNLSPIQPKLQVQPNPDFSNINRTSTKREFDKENTLPKVKK